MSELAPTLDLEVRNGVQPAETLRISRRQPICIGRHASNDICIDDAEVAPIHCRVAWNGSEFEVAAANRDGVDVNGTIVRHSALKVGDVMRIGPADLLVREPPPDVSSPLLPVLPDPQAADPSGVIPLGDVPLRPVTEEGIAAHQGWDRGVQHGFVGLSERLQRAEGNQRAASPPLPAAPQAATTSERIEAILDVEEDEESNEPVVVLPGTRGRGTSLAERLSARRVRPGEQEALRSPVILIMLGTTLALGLAAAAIYFVIGRESTQRDFDAANAEFGAKHYGQAAEMFQKFIADHSGHALAADAHYKMWNARILKEIGGGSPSWKRGLETLDQSIDANRDRKDFRDHNDELVDFLTQIALGASASAQSSADRSQLEISSSAEAMLPRYFPEGKMPADLAAKLRTSYTTAQEAIIKHDVVADGLAAIEKDNAARQPMAALAARRALLARYSEVANDPKLGKLLTETLNVEKALVVREEMQKPAVAHPSDTGPRTLTLAMHTRSRSEESAGARPVLVLAKDCLYAVDHTTGEPIWRRVIGLDSPFFPVKVETSVPALLVFNPNRLSLMLLARNTGKSIWERTLDEVASGAPLVDQGQIYLATLGRHLYKIDLESGRITTRITFSQKILSPPALTRNKERMIVAGDASLIYTLTTSPLECIRVNDLGHAAGSLVNGVTSVGGLALLTEPGRGSGTRLHVLEAQSEETWLKQVDVQTVEGQVRDAPVIYGKMLFVSSVPARISAFAVSDTPGQESLIPTTSLAIPNQKDSPIFLSPGPDGQLWMAGSSVRQLQLKLNSQAFSLNAAEIAVGISSQPLQVVGQYLYAARRLPYAGSVLFSQIDREPMTGEWRTVFGSSILATSVFAGGAIVTVGEAGDVFSVGADELSSVRFKSTATAVIDPDPKNEIPLRATRLHDGKIAVESAGPQPKLSFVGLGGQISGSLTIEKPLEAPPVDLNAGLVLPLPGRLKLVSPSSGVPAAEEQLAPLEGGKPARWKSVERISEDEVVALDSRGRLSVFRHRTEPVRNLAEIVARKVEGPCDTGLAVVASRVVYGDAEGVLHFLNAAELEPVATHKLSAPAVGRLWTTGSLLFAETRDHKLAAYDASGPTKPLFVAPLGQTGPSGPPALIRDRLIVANRDGSVLSLDPSRGTVLARATIDQPLSGGVISVDGHAVVSTIDGSLCRIDSLLEPQKNGT
jgi:PQQ-like domain/FHA domain